MKLQKFRNIVFNLGKILAIFTIALTSIATVILFAYKIYPDLDTIFYSIDWLRDFYLGFTEFIMNCLEICTFYGSVFVLPSLFGLSAILTGIIAFKNHDAKEFLKPGFLIILAGVFLPFALILLPELLLPGVF